MILREAPVRLAILALVLGAIGFSWRKGRRFGGTLFDDVSRIRKTLSDADATIDLPLEVSPRSMLEKAASQWTTASAKRVWFISPSRIPADKLHRVFNAFKPVDGFVSRQDSGTGLGLALAKQMITMLGGDLSVDSQPCMGSAFTLLLPVTSRQARAAVASGQRDPAVPLEPAGPQPFAEADRAQATSDANGALAGFCLHLFDDDARFAHAISRAARNSGARVCHHTSAAVASGQ